MTLFYILAARKEWMKWVKVGELKIGKAMEGRLEEAAPYALLGVVRG